MDNHQLESNLEKFLAFFMVIFSFINWFGSGYIAWYWVYPTSFLGAIGFIIAWVLMGWIGTIVILPILTMIILGIASFFKGSNISPIENNASILPPVSLSQNSHTRQKNKIKDTTIWWILGACAVGLVLYYSTTSNNSKNVPSTTGYSTAQTTSPSDYHSKSSNATAQCYDGTYSHSTERRGTCSHHGGVQYWLDSQSSSYIPPPPSISTTTPSSNPTVTMSVPPVAPAVTTPTPAPTPSNENQVVQAQAEYNAQIANLNQAWKQLTPSGRKQILADQRTFNQKREAECQQYALTTTNDTNQQTTANLLCQIERLKQRTQYLKTYSHTMAVLPPNLPNKPPQVAKKVETPQTPELQKAKQSYNMAIGALNLTWGKLDPKLKESIRLEQRADNQQREAQCQKYAQSLSSNNAEKEIARLSCEVPLIQERTEYLKNLTSEDNDD